MSVDSSSDDSDTECVQNTNIKDSDDEAADDDDDAPDNQLSRDDVLYEGGYEEDDKKEVPHSTIAMHHSRRSISLHLILVCRMISKRTIFPRPGPCSRTQVQRLLDELKRGNSEGKAV